MGCLRLNFRLPAVTDSRELILSTNNSMKILRNSNSLLGMSIQIRLSRLMKKRESKNLIGLSLLSTKFCVQKRTRNSAELKSLPYNIPYSAQCKSHFRKHPRYIAYLQTEERSLTTDKYAKSFNRSLCQQRIDLNWLLYRIPILMSLSKIVYSRFSCVPSA
jgi:hypothetical protein